MDGLKTKEDRRFQTFWVIFFILISVIAIIPVLRVISISFSGRDAINKGQVFIFPIGFNVDAYAKALKSGYIRKLFWIFHYSYGSCNCS